MGVDRRGKKRKRCLQAECDCDEYEMPMEGNDCDYCGCKPTKHEVEQDQEEAMLYQHEVPNYKRRKMAIELQGDIFSDADVAAVPVIDETPCEAGLQDDESFVKVIAEIRPCTPEEPRCSASTQRTATSSTTPGKLRLLLCFVVVFTCALSSMCSE